MAPSRVTPTLLFADADGNIYDHPDLLMLCRRGRELALPRPDEMTPLPEGSDLYLLPCRNAIGLNPETGQIEAMEEYAVAAFVCPGYTLSGTAAYRTGEGAPCLPLFAYGAVGYAKGRFWVAARQVDTDPRQVFGHIPNDRIDRGAHALLKKFPDNRLIQHLSKCALTYCCPAAKNLALGRYEAPVPTSRTCNARCIGCISLQPEDSGFPSPQNRIGFTPTVQEICEVMHHHQSREKKPIYSFGQGCEGEPLTEAELLSEAIRTFRAAGGKGTVNINTNASLPETMEPLAAAGLSSIRVSLNSARREVYSAYYRPKGYAWEDVVETIARAKKHGLFVSLNYLFFPGLSDTEEELEALTDLVSAHTVDLIQMRNLSLDPEVYLERLARPESGPSMGLRNFMKRLRRSCPWLKFGYFNPYLGD
jgi:wyosine [tRNA(Phe)-imidazoG37] synthetase (radical SAM superfamily)